VLTWLNREIYERTTPVDSSALVVATMYIESWQAKTLWQWREVMLQKETVYAPQLDLNMILIL
jgi:hypothetical protein